MGEDFEIAVRTIALSLAGIGPLVGFIIVAISIVSISMNRTSTSTA